MGTNQQRILKNEENFLLLQALKLLHESFKQNLEIVKVQSQIDFTMYENLIIYFEAKVKEVTVLIYRKQQEIKTLLSDG